jgi:serine/threonine protein kinase
MSSGKKGKTDPQLRVDDSEDVISFPANAEPTDECPTIISKSRPTVDPKPNAADNVTDLASRSIAAGSIAKALRGQRLAHFELIEPIGVGGMAAVLKARDTQLDRQVALKILPPEMAADPENVRRFHQEAKAAARLDHGNIARVFYCGEDQGLHFIAFEFVEGDNLRTLMDRRGRLPVAEAVRYILQVATGLEHAASRGVVHRDVKPSNIIITPTGHAKLVDMGLARNLERQDGAELTQSGVTLGTFDYISPEQALEPREADARSDIYSLGCTFYHMLTGQPPVPEGTAAKKLHHHQHVAPLDPRQLNPDIPDEVALILGRMMAKDPRARYQRPVQLVQHLMQVASSVGAADDLPEGVLFVDTPLPTNPPRRPVLVISLAGLLLVAIFMALGLYPSDPPTPTGPFAQGNGKTERPGGQNSEVVATPVQTVPRGENAPIVTAEQLAAVLADPGIKNRHVIRLMGSIPVTSVLAVPAGVSELTITSTDKSAPATLHFKVQTTEMGTFEDVGLQIGGGKVHFDNVRILIEASANPESARAAITVRGAEVVTFSGCCFEQAVPAINPAYPGIASVLIDAVPGIVPKQPQVQFRKCRFGDGKGQSVGQVAVAVNGPARVVALDCGFMPHTAYFHVRGEADATHTSVALDHCSSHVVGPVFRLDAGADVTARSSIFAKYDGTTSDSIQPDLILPSAQPSEVSFRFHGENNRYYLNALWGGRSLQNTVALFRDALEKKADGSADVGSEVLAESPWHLAQPVQAGPERTFQVKAEFDDFGVRQLPSGAMLARVPATVPAVTLAANEKLFDPAYKGKQPGIYTSFSKALSNLEKGDVLLVKPGTDGRPIEVPPIVFRPADQIDITLRAYPGTAPVLKLAKPADKKDLAFFRLLEGKLSFEGLHFLLEPWEDANVAQSILLLGEKVECVFDRCVITLHSREVAGHDVPLSAVALSDPRERMMGKLDQPQPMSSIVTFSNSFIRGDGDLASLSMCRPLNLVLDHSLAVLSGSLVSVQGCDEASNEAGPDVDLKRSSVFAREATFLLRAAKSGKGLGKTHVNARSCLFAALGSRPLVYLKAADVMSENQLQSKYLAWDGEEKNCYARFDKDKLLEYERSDEPGTAMQLAVGDWTKISEKEKNIQSAATFAALPEGTFWLARPELFHPMEPELQAAGCGSLETLDSLLKAMPPK